MDKIELVIEFICDLVDDTFDNYLDYFPAKFYFLNGGCLEFAKVLKNYFPESDFVISNDLGHFALQIGENIYDCTGIIKNKNDFFKVDKDYIIKKEHLYGIPEIKFERKEAHKAIINEIELCSGEYVKKLVK